MSWALHSISHLGIRLKVAILTSSSTLLSPWSLLFSHSSCRKTQLHKEMAQLKSIRCSLTLKLGAHGGLTNVEYCSVSLKNVKHPVSPLQCSGALSTQLEDHKPEVA